VRARIVFVGGGSAESKQIHRRFVFHGYSGVVDAGVTEE
jgi:hypothetical protein